MAVPREDIAKISGPESMGPPAQAPSTSNQPLREGSIPEVPPKKKKHRGGRKKRNARASFTVTSQDDEESAQVEERPNLLDVPQRSAQSSSYYRNRRNGSNTSLESEALLDHREHSFLSSRRHSLSQSGFTRQSGVGLISRQRGSTASGPMAKQQRSKLAYATGAVISEDEDEDMPLNDRTPLLSRSRNHSRPQLSRTSSSRGFGTANRGRRSSTFSKASSNRKMELTSHSHTNFEEEGYDVNNPPSMPTSPNISPINDLLGNDLSVGSVDRGRDAIIDIDGDDRRFSDVSPEAMRRRATVADVAVRDVCFPHDADLSEIEDEDRHSTSESARLRRRRTRHRGLPDLEILEAWSREEKEERTVQEHIRVKKINEPVMVGGRLRPGKTAWHKEEEEEPFRFTYFNENFDATIHARTISDLLQEGTTFKDLFLPEPVELTDDSEDEDTDENNQDRPSMRSHLPAHVMNGRNSQQSRHAPSHRETSDARSPVPSQKPSRSATPSQTPTPTQPPTHKRYGPRPTFWLDVLQPTDLEMQVLSKAFGIHQLTTEDILVDEEREKVELFPNYYFVNYRTFEQDKDSENYMDPINFYAVVFREGVITFHHYMTPHPANVRRRIRQLGDYLTPSSDFISYALIDDITDVYQPRVNHIEEEVDEIDDEILHLHQASADAAEDGPEKAKSSKAKSLNEKNNDNNSDAGDKLFGDSGGDLLRRVGESRKKVMGLYRLLGNKADVIKSFAKRCNESWDVAPRSEIGLYLGDIQDHIVTMSSNLSHYESLLSRAHSNYMAQISISMNERAEKNADVLGKLTVVGTIVLPMNIITGMWGMNVWVPGQEYEGNLTWFWCITAGLMAFGVTCFFIARKMYGIV